MRRSRRLTGARYAALVQRSARLRGMPVLCRARPRGGHTLIEVLVACVVFAVGTLAVQGAAVNALRQARDAYVRQQSASLALLQLEPAVSGPCALSLTGSQVVRGVRIDWSVGPAAAAHAREVIQTARYLSGGALRSDTYRSAVRCR
jgi:type II secretory pathway pseudopilin PulG